MKLRINAKLRAALIAAITAVGFTLTQAQADQVLSVTTPSGQQLESKNSGINWSEDTGNLTSWALTFNFYENRDLGAYDLFGTNGGAGAQGDVLKTTAEGAITLTAGGSTISSATGSFTKQNQVAVTLSYKADYNQFGTSLNSGTYTLKVGEGEAVTLAVTNDSNSTFIKNGNTKLWTNQGNEKFYNIALTRLENNIIQVTASQWMGQPGANEWVSSNFQPEFSTGKDVVFDATGYNTVVVKDAVQAGALTVSGTDYTFDIQSDGILSAKSVNVAEGGTIKLEGAGTYVLPTDVFTKGNVTYGDNWTGAVRVANQTHQDNNSAWISNLGSEKSWVEFSNFTGYDSGWKGTVSANIKLTKDADNHVAWNLSAFATGWNTMKATGKWAGDGTFRTAGGKDTQMQAIEYTGDISGWTGAFQADCTGARKVTFSGSATKVNADVVKTGGAKDFEVVVNTNAAFASGKSVTADLLTVNAGKTATLNGTTTLGNVALASDATLVNAGTMTINGTITFGTKAIENNASSAISFGDGIRFNLTGMTPVSNVYTLFTGTGAAIDLRGYDATYITVAGGTAGKTWSFNDNGTISFTVSSGKVWTDSAGTGKWNYEDANWDGATFESGDVAQFNDYSEVTVNDDVVAGGIQANGLVFIGNDEQTPGSLTSPGVEVADEAYLFTTLTVEGVESYTVGAEGAWTISADQTLAAGTGSGDGIINVMDGGSVTFTGTATEADWSRVANDGTVNMNLGGATAKIDMSDSSGVLAVSNGKVDYRSNLDNQTLKMGSGTTLLFGNNDGTKDDAVFSNNIVLDGDATVEVYGDSKHSSVTISGDVEGAHTLTKADGNQNLTFSGKVDIAGLTTASNGNGTIIFKGGEGSVGYIKTLNAVTIQFSAKEGADNIYSFDTFNMSSDDNQTNATRWLVVDSGVTLNGTGNSRKYGSTIENSWGVNGGGLKIDGTLNTEGIIAMDAGATTAYIKGSGLINTKGLDLCNNTKTYIQDGITINITSDTGIYKRNNDAEVHLKDATLKATTVDWSLKDGGTGYKVTLDDTETGTTFDVAAERTITVANILGGDGKLVKAGEGTLILTKNNTYTGDTVVKGGTLQVNGSLSADSTISVEGDAILAGTGVDIANVSIAATKTATFKDGITTEEGVVFAKEGGVEVKNTSAEGGSSIQYGIDQAAAQVTADTMTVDGDTGVEIANSLVVKEIVNNNANGLVLKGNVADDVTLRAVDGNIVMTGQTSNTVSVVDLDIAPGNAVTLMDDQQEEGTITVSGVLKGAEAAVYADLTLLGGSTLNVSGGNDKALTLGSELTIDLSNKSLVNLDDDTLIALNNMGAGETLKLIVSVDSVLDALTYGADYDGMGYDELFSRIGGQLTELEGNYTVYAKDDAFGLTKQGAVPEPTTGTLSLLALMALAARRRRK